MTKQVAYFIGLITCICGAVLGQAELLGEPFRHYISVAFIAGTAITGFLIKTPSPWDGIDRRK